MRAAKEHPVQCVIAGGSLVGLSAAIALSRLGIDVTVLERSPARADDGGGGLGVDVALLGHVTGISAQPPVVHGIDRDTTAWHLLQSWLEEHAVRRSGVTVHRGVQVTSVSPGNDAEAAAVVAEDGSAHHADLVVGADGARSIVRTAVDPEHPGARYAGVLLWRAMVNEQALPAGLALLAAGEPSREVYAGPYRLVTYLVPGAAGETAVGRRRLNMVWYDPQQRELLRDRGLLEGDTIHGSLAPGTLPGPVRERLAEFAAANWPAPWRQALELALREGKVFGTPVVHYEPRRMARGRVALAGDAAHAASPMVGGGFRQGLYDVAALADVLTAISAPADIPAALRHYQERRLRPAAQHVAVSERATAAYLAHAAHKPST